MFKKIILCLGILLISSPISAQQDLLQTIRLRNAFAYEQVTLDATAGGIALTSATYNPTVVGTPSSMTRAELAIMNCQTAQARYKVDGVAAVTTSLGMIVNPGDTLQIYGFANIAAFRGIRTGAVSAVCDITYYRNQR